MIHEVLKDAVDIVFLHVTSGTDSSVSVKGDGNTGKLRSRHVCVHEVWDIFGVNRADEIGKELELVVAQTFQNMGLLVVSEDQD